MRYQKNVAGVLLLLSVATQGSLLGSAAMAKPKTFYPNTQIEAARPALEVPEKEEPPSTPQPTAAPAPPSTPKPIPTPKPASKAPSIYVPANRQEVMAAAGISESDFAYVAFIIDHENGAWEPCKQNGGIIDCTYTGQKSYGICQSKPGSKMAMFGSDWQTNPVTQMKWCNYYANERYKGWENAYGEWLSKKWW